MPPESDVHMSLGDHLEELRRRLIFGLVGLVPVVLVTLYFGKTILEFLLDPAIRALRDAGLPGDYQVTGPVELFAAYLKISLIAAAVVGAPWFLYQLWRFISPGLYDRERRFVYVLIPLSAVMTVSSVVFLFKVIMPFVLVFFIGFGSDIGQRAVETRPLPEGAKLGTVLVLDADPPSPQPGDEWINRPLVQRRICVGLDADGAPQIMVMNLSKDTPIHQQYRVQEYLSLLTALAVAFVIAFQTPVVILLVGWAGFVDVALLQKYRRHSLLGCAIAAAVLSPGDPTSMIALLVPLYLLYELGILLLRFFPSERVRRGLTRAQRERTAQEDAEEEDRTP